jgi:hypothetical protein
LYLKGDFFSRKVHISTWKIINQRCHSITVPVNVLVDDAGARDLAAAPAQMVQPRIVLARQTQAVRGEQLLAQALQNPGRK